MSPREKALERNSLVCLLQALKGHKTKVELRNENIVEGIVTDVDAYSNINLVDVWFSEVGKLPVHFEDLYLAGKSIRYVHIPDQINMLAAIKQQLALNKRISTHSRQERVYSTKKPKAKVIAEVKRAEQEKLDQLPSCLSDLPDSVPLLAAAAALTD